jgi:hypothetical protein
MRNPTGFWRRCRTLFRHLRHWSIFLFLLLLCALVWLNRIGLPDFLKQPLVEKLRAHGIELEFVSLRLSLWRGLVADNVHIGRTGKAESPTLSLRQVQLRLNYPALLHRHLQIDGLVLREGKLVWPLSRTNMLVLDQVRFDLRFQTNDTWSLDNFQAAFAGAKLTLSGDITHASALRNWDVYRGQTTNTSTWRARADTFAGTLRRIRFAGTPQLNLTINGDARDLHSFRVHLMVNGTGIDTPWGRAATIQLTTRLMTFNGAPANTNSAWGWWTNLQPYRIDWTAEVEGLESDQLNAGRAKCSGFWRAPELTVTNLSAELGGGGLETGARLDVDTRRFTFTNSSHFDPRAIEVLLTQKTRGWLAQFSWTQPPVLQVRGSFILPAWTNNQLDWHDEVQPTVQLAGEFAVTNAGFHDITVDSARGDFSYSNLVWRLPHLVVLRPEGALTLTDVENDATKKYHWHVQGVLAPSALLPLLTASQADRLSDVFTFNEPLSLNAEAGGLLYDNESIGATGHLAMTNFTIRGETVSSVESDFRYTNRCIEFFKPRLQTGAQKMMADGVTVDFNSWRIYFTNGFGTADPRAVARAIGVKAGEVMDPYRFGVPCPAQVNGYAPLRGLEDADLWFEGGGAPFEWLRLKTPRITGRIHWLGETLILTNLTAAAYGGEANGFAHFDFHPKQGTDFEFIANVRNADLHLLATDLSSPTNRLEGILSGRFVMTSANSASWRTWNGYGQVNLHDGLIWDVPVFGILSPVLNSIIPGLGSSRATDAVSQFGMTNGVIFSDNLDMRSTMMRLQYAGTVDLQSKVNARVDAQLLRDTWVVGPLLSTALWPVSKLFEYQITGTLQEPQMEPVYIPKAFLAPLHPIRSLEEMLSNGVDTNALPLW